MKFIDEVTILVNSGKGGPGCVSFRREAKLARGGPDGGDGGKGGDVIFRADPRLGSLLDLKLKRKYSAEHGQQGSGSKCTGADGKDLVLHVPIGTVLRDPDGNIVADLDREGDFILLEGGKGGKGNTFYKSSINQAPEIAQKGLPGQEQEISLELKLIADVGIIGLPNAGKSTLISRISAAKPKVADYPFTTLVPNLGVVRIDELRNFVVADIPGLIKGAHEGVGLGTQFLRHIERTRIFVHVIDISDKMPDEALAAYQEINNELGKHDEKNKLKTGYKNLADRPQYVVFNKVDAVDEELFNEAKDLFYQNGVQILPISAVSGLNIKKFIFDIGERVLADGE